jgi:hypothetical protein
MRGLQVDDPIVNQVTWMIEDIGSLSTTRLLD